MLSGRHHPRQELLMFLGVVLGLGMPLAGGSEQPSPGDERVFLVSCLAVSKSVSLTACVLSWTSYGSLGPVRGAWVSLVFWRS